MVDRSGLLAEHIGPQLHKLGLIETAVAIGVEHVYHGDGRLLVNSHHVFYHVHHLLRTQNSIAVFIKFSKTPRYLVISVVARAHTQTHNYLIYTVSQKKRH